MVGEIDTTSIEPVRHGVSLFDDKSDPKKFLPTWNKRDYEKEIEDLTKELASYKVQLEAKHVAHIKALLKPEQNQKMIHELSTLLKNSDIERNKYVNECSESRASKDGLESMTKEMADLKLETVKVRDQLSHVLSELKATQRELVDKDTEICMARDSELNALEKAEQLENELKMEKEHKEELLQQVTSAKEEIIELNNNNQSLIDELKMSKERDIETQVEISLLKSKSHLQEYSLAYKNGSYSYVTDQSKDEAEKLNREKEKEKEKDNDSIRISLEEYNYLVKEVAKGSEKGNEIELAFMKRELENASLKISEMRNRAEQAISRAELAENGKAALEDKIRRHREHRLRKKAALTALREESTPKPFTPSTSYGTPSLYQPLSKVLNMKL
ncbi:uncharacterized protein LOC127135253 [Lathyrus oleraceus]|uniref:Uncharacterized protein n=1 Tax=Pisum sativum TaxID=3888 RepID=A0A9D4X8P8_PEA|nr:uncharacterized protein LOC127135253 [Pisum sativum]KAI5416639.1 hypothetical protein KIW84_041606 [Pisum sativum]